MFLLQRDCEFRIERVDQVDRHYPLDASRHCGHIATINDRPSLDRLFSTDICSTLLRKRPHALVSLDRRGIGHGSCIIPLNLALRIGDRGDGAAWRSHRRDWDSGVVGHMRFLAQGEERVAALELSSIFVGVGALERRKPNEP